MQKFSNFKVEKFKMIKEDAETPIDMAIPTEAAIVKSEPAKFVSKMFESREMAHIYHLQVKGEGSYAAHKALDEFYNGILDLIDEFIETYQGQYDIIENYDIIDSNQTHNIDRIQYFIDLVGFIKATRNVAFLPEDTHLQNIIDEMVGLIYRTLYKLKNLK